MMVKVKIQISNPITSTINYIFYLLKFLGTRRYVLPSAWLEISCCERLKKGGKKYELGTKHIRIFKLNLINFINLSCEFVCCSCLNIFKALCQCLSYSIISL